MSVGYLNEVEYPSLSYNSMSYTHLLKWMMKNEEFVSAYAPSTISTNGENLYSKQLIQNRFMSPCTSNFFTFKIKVSGVNSAELLQLMVNISNKIDEQRSVFVEAESVEHGISTKTADERVSLLINIFKYLSSFCGRTVPLPSYSNSSDCHSPLLSLYGQIAVCIMSYLESSFHIHESKFYSCLLFLNILSECGIEVSLDNSSSSDFKVDNYLAPHDQQFSAKETPMLVFSTADIDSALDCSVNAAWFTHGLVSWAITTILVQEPIYEQFIISFKDRLQSSFENHYFINSNHVTSDTKDYVNRIITEASNRHLEIFEVEVNDTNSFKPTLIIGDFVSCQITCNLIFKYRPVPVIFVVPFRTVAEGISLANESSRKLAVSVWSESYSTCMTAASQLDFGTVWLNSFGLFDVRVPFFNRTNCFHPEYLMGIEAFRWNQCKVKTGILTADKDKPVDSAGSGKNLNELIANAYEAHRAWKNIGIGEKVQILNQILLHAKFEDYKLTHDSEFKESLFEAMHQNVSSSCSQKMNNCSVMQIIEPIGVIVFILESYKESLDILLRHIMKAIFSNNVVILSGDPANIILKLLSPFFEKNILNEVNISLKILCNFLKNHKLRNNVNVWHYNHDRKVFCTYKDNSGCNEYFEFLLDFDFNNHTMKRKIVWMPVC